MMEEAQLLRATAIAAFALMEEDEAESEEERKERKYGVHPMNKQRPSSGAFRINFSRLKSYPDKFKTIYRVTPSQFKEILFLVKPSLERKPNSSFPISPAERLALTLHYLGSGTTAKSLAVMYRLGHSTALKIIDETAIAIWNTLSPIYVKVPNCPADWKKISDEYMSIWNFPHCVGALDGKHIRIKCPANTGSVYYNYKNFFSIVLLAVVDARYRFVCVDVGGVGGSNDSGLFATSQIRSIFTEEMLPPPDSIAGIDEKMPYYLVADDAFALTPNMMKPFGGGELPRDKQIFNIRLSRARRCVENCFGVLSHRWRVFLTGFEATPEHVKQRTKACIALHNFLSKDSPVAEWSENTVRRDESAKQAMHSVASSRARNSSNKAKSIREKLKTWCVGEGALQWQETHVVTPH